MKFSKLFSFSSLLTSLTIMIYIFYRSEIIYDGNKIEYYINYYILASIFIVFSLLSFYLNKSHKIIITIILITVLISLYIFELLINKGFLEITRHELRAAVAKKNNIDFDDRKKIDVYYDLKKNNPDIVITMHPSQFIQHSYDLFSIGGISNKTTIHCNENGYYSIYKSDRYGFNNPDEEWNKKNIKFLVIGDSLIHGSCVNEEKTITGTLRSKINNQGVINLAYKGIGPLIENAALREYGSQIEYKNVLWVYSGNDIQDIETEYKNKILLSYFNDDSYTQNLVKKQDLIDNQLIDYFEKEQLLNNSILKFLKLSSVRKLLYWRDKTEAKKEKSLENLENFKISLLQSKSIVEDRGAKFYFVYLPWFNRYDKDSTYKDDDQIYYDQVIKIVNELNIPIIDIHRELFSLSSDPKDFFPFRMWGHYTAETYDMISDLIIKRINFFESQS